MPGLSPWQGWPMNAKKRNAPQLKLANFFAFTNDPNGLSAA
jgi:hypothetical protein